MELNAKVFGVMEKAVTAVFLVTLCAGFFLPVYTDEIGWRFMERAGLDGVDKGYSDGCGPNTLAVPPFFMMPVRYYSALFNTLFADPLFVRLSGILYAFIWLFLTLKFIRALVRDHAGRAELTIIGVGLLCLGTTPLLLVWSRPEQPILIAVTGALVSAWKWRESPAVTAASAWLRPAFVVGLTIIALSYHLKAMFLIPVFLFCLFAATSGPAARTARWAMTSLMTLITVWSAYYWIGRLQCPGDPIVRGEHAANNLGVLITSSESLVGILKALGQIAANANLLRYFVFAAPRPAPMAHWLEAGQIGTLHSLAWIGFLVLIWTCVAIVTAGILLLKVRQAWRARELEPRLVLAALLAAAALCWSATQSHRNVYEASFVLPLLMLAAMVAMSGYGPDGWIFRAIRALATVIGLCALVSPWLIAALFAPSLARANAQSGYIAAQRNSQPVLGYAQVKPEIMGAARLCGIPDPAKAKALMVDEVTYLAFVESRLPQHYLGVVGLWRGKIDDPMAYLRSRGSDGVIMGCHKLPGDLRRRARSQGRFCCLRPDD